MKVIRPHDPKWVGIYATEAAALRARLGAAALRLEHIGSTAVPGIFAKPIIDIVVEAVSLEALDARTGALMELGYEARGEHGIAGRRYFKKHSGGAGVGFHVHGFSRGNPEIARHIRFRDFLLARPDVAQAYSALKQDLAGADGALPADFAARKSDFVRHVEQLAEAHFRAG